MKRAASTLQFNLVKDLVESTGNGKALSTFETRSGQLYYSCRYVITKGHPFKRYDCLPFLEYNCIPFLSVRHPLDCLVSIQQLQTCSYWEALKQVSIACDMLVEWVDNHSNYYLMRYEDLFAGNHIVRLFAQLYSMASYLDIKLNSETAINIALNNSHQKIKATTDAQKINDPRTWYTSSHLNDGKVGKYKEMLGKKEIDYGSKQLKEFMTRFKYES